MFRVALDFVILYLITNLYVITGNIDEGYFPWITVGLIIISIFRLVFRILFEMLKF